MLREGQGKEGRGRTRRELGVLLDNVWGRGGGWMGRRVIDWWGVGGMGVSTWARNGSGAL